jgi:hypothetical protein
MFTRKIPSCLVTNLLIAAAAASEPQRVTCATSDAARLVLQLLFAALQALVLFCLLARLSMTHHTASICAAAAAAAAADAVLDACLAQDPSSKVACETAVKDNFMLVFGEITSRAEVDYAGALGTIAFVRLVFCFNCVCWPVRSRNRPPAGQKWTMQVRWALQALTRSWVHGHARQMSAFCLRRSILVVGKRQQITRRAK